MTLDEKMRAAVKAYFAAFENIDVDAVMALYSDDCSVEDPVGTEPLQGRDAVRAFYAEAMTRDVKLELQGNVRTASNEAVFAFQGEIDTPDGRIHFDPIDHMVFDEDGKITSMRAFWGPANSGKL